MRDPHDKLEGSVPVGAPIELTKAELINDPHGAQLKRQVEVSTEFGGAAEDEALYSTKICEAREELKSLTHESAAGETERTD